MYVRLKGFGLSTLLTVAASASAIAQSAGSPAPSTPTPPAPAGGFGAWISGHPVMDFLVVLAIFAVIAGSYFMRRRSRA